MNHKMYPPNGGEPIIPHPTKVEEYKAKGWTFEPPKKVKPKTKLKED